MTGLKVAVIGGGFTGLACATRLLSSGHQVHLYEREAFLGGLASGFKNENWEWTLEKFYHHWFKTDEYVIKFAKEWGVEKEIFFKCPSSVFQTELNNFAPLDSAKSLLRFEDLIFFNRLRMGICLFYLKVTKNWEYLEQITAEKWCLKYMGREGYNAIWRPLLRGKFGEIYASQVNMAWLWARISCRSRQLGYCRGGFSTYIHAAETYLRKLGAKINLECANISILESDKKWTVKSNEQEIIFDAIVVAASSFALEKLLGRLPMPAKPFLGAQVVVLSLKSKLGNHYWYSLKKNAKQPFLALVEHTNFISAKHYNEENLIYLADYVDTQSGQWKRSDKELIDAAVQTCRLVNSGFSENEILKTWVFRESYAQPVPLVSESKRIPSIKVDGFQNLFHASMGHVYPWDRGTNFALELGEKAALLVK